ncbi:hypothetical protein QBZ16_003888 [Prototheca wickerhamii]|uniref:E3 ubiquitin-protein ligase synoviolin-like TPR repeats domain-containing protein n=1 Tax=Prototheca wickerhamii TaxID=3111 RepID=A0AAD9IJX8_PROWI|nr:hypothetical protein QBZ16_003888 [Prototheca wickerhamii]
MIVTSIFLASGSGLWYQLAAPAQAGAHPSASWAADSLSRAWHEGVDPHVAFDNARTRSTEVLEEAIQSQLGFFFLCSLFLSTYALGALVTKALFLGRLTIIESTKLAERMLKFVMLKVVFLGAVVNPEPHELGTWLLWFAVLAYFRGFVGLARDRCEALLSSPSATPLQHARCLVLLGGILGQTASWMGTYAAATLPDPTPARVSHALLWLFDAVCIFIEASHAILKYGVHAAERFRAQRAEAAGEPAAAGGWEGQAPLLYHAEVLVDLTLHVLTLTHYCHLWYLHGFKLQLIDAVLFLDIRYLVVGIWRRVRGFARYRALTHRLQHSFPPIPADRLADRDCAICMERLQSARARCPAGTPSTWAACAPGCSRRTAATLSSASAPDQGPAAEPSALAHSRSDSSFPSPSPSLPAPLFDLLAGRGRAPHGDGREDDASEHDPRHVAGREASIASAVPLSISSLRPRSWGVGGASALDDPHSLTDKVAQVSVRALSSGIRRRASRCGEADEQLGRNEAEEVSSRPQRQDSRPPLPPSPCASGSRLTTHSHRYGTRQQTRSRASPTL